MKAKFSYILERESAQLDCAYDLAAFCYDYLIDRIKNQPLFIGEYICENRKANINNPNLEKLLFFSEKIKHILYRQKAGADYALCQSKLKERVKEMEDSLVEYGKEELNNATIPFFILLAIDRYVLERRGECTNRNPLNQQYHKKSYIYLNVRENLWDIMSKNRVVKDATIGNMMEHLIFLEKKALPPEVKKPPRIVPLYIGEEDLTRQKVLNSKKLKVAVIPFGQKRKIDIKMDRGALFSVEYLPDHKINGEKHAIELLNLVIDEKANIIIFPEFVCEKKIQRAIRKELENIYQNTPERINHLLLVVAGTRWENGNNIADILAYDGRLLGHQYKCVPYSSLKNDGEKLVERLKNPGKECTIVEIDKLGKIMFGICRDVVAEAYIAHLTEFFSPQFLLIPAWSNSVNRGFKGPLRRISSKNHTTCSVMCNCCEAYCGSKRFKREVGMVVSPDEKGRSVIGRADMICRNETDCREECRASGCVFIVSLTESLEHNKNQGILVNVEQEFRN